MSFFVFVCRVNVTNIFKVQRASPGKMVYREFLAPPDCLVHQVPQGNQDYFSIQRQNW